MRLKVKILEFLAGKPIAILHRLTARKMNTHVGDRILISKNEISIIAVVDTAEGFIERDELAVSNEVVSSLNLKKGESLEVSLTEKPETTSIIKKKMDGHSLSKEEIEKIIKNIVRNSLSEAEVAFYVSAIYKNGMNNKETEDLIEAMVSTGQRLSFKGKIVDKHSIGGIAANRTTPIVVSICSSAGLIMPKTSSRAITSAAGTADTIESIAKVEFSAEEIKEIVRKHGACMVWGGSLGLSPADDKLIQVERVLDIDPEAQLLASVLSKKISVGSKYVLIDIPYGKSAKVDKKKGLRLKEKFEYLGKRFGLKIKCVLTSGESPIGRGIGPILEIIDVIKVLERKQDAPKDLEEKSLFLAGEILELCGQIKKGKGKEAARAILNSGKALDKFKEIILAQDGKVEPIEVLKQKLGKHKHEIFSNKNSRVKEIDNKKINLIASIAGCPIDKGSGIYLNKSLDEKITKGDKLLTIYSDSELRLRNALEVCNKIKPIVY